MDNNEERNSRSLLVRSVMSLYEGGRARVRVDFELSDLRTSCWV